MPLIGGKLEKLMADQIEAGYQVEHDGGPGLAGRDNDEHADCGTT